MRATGLMAPPLLAALATKWVLDGTAESILAAVRDEATARQNLARELMPVDRINAHPNGHHVWLQLPGHWSQAEFVGEARARGVAVVPSEVFAAKAEPSAAVRITLGAASDRKQLAEILATLVEVLHGQPSALSGVV